MKQIYENKADQVTIFSDGKCYFGEYIVWRMPIQEKRREVPKSVAEAYMHGEHTANEFIYYMNYGVWAPKLDQWHSNQAFLRRYPELLSVNPKESKAYFSDEEFAKLLKRVNRRKI